MLPLLLAVLAQTPDYPRVVHKGDQTCVESLDSKNKVVTECRTGSGDYKPSEGREPARPSAREPLPSYDPVSSAPSVHMRAPGAAYYSPEVSALLHAAQTKYNWALGFKIAAVPLLLLSAGGLISLASQAGQPGAGSFLGGSLAGNLVLLAGAAICIIVGVVLDNSAGADVESASSL